MELKCFIIIFCHIYLSNINHDIKSLVCTERQHTHNWFSDVHIVICQHHIRYNLFREQQQVGHLLKKFRMAPPMTNISVLPFSSMVIHNI